MAAERIGVIGAGTMGAGIAQVAAQSGYDVVLVDQADEWVQRGLTTIHGHLDRAVSKERLTGAERAQVAGRIAGTTDYGRLAGSALVVEAVNEDPGIKSAVLKQVAANVADAAIIASNTSSISITALASLVPNPARVIGMHFFNPVPVLKLVEVVRGLQTSDGTAATVREIAVSLGKTPVDVADHPGFVANRIVMPMINEAVICLSEGVATAEAIDEVMKLGMAHPMGPLALADLIGLDVCLGIMEVLHHDLGDDKYSPAPLLRRMVAAGRLGRKTGQGFFSYEQAGK